MFTNRRLPVPLLPTTPAAEMSATDSALVARPPLGTRLEHLIYGFGRVLHHIGSDQVGIVFEQSGYKIFVWQVAHTKFTTAPPAR